MRDLPALGSGLLAEVSAFDKLGHARRSRLLALLIGYAGLDPLRPAPDPPAGLGDVRSIGSGNIGATNVLRTGRKGLAAATLMLDAAKGAAAVLIVRVVLARHAAAAGAGRTGAFLGHLFPVWLLFKGGKGMAT